jgi:hypothetical protein
MPPNNNYSPNNSPNYNNHHNGSQWSHAHSSRNHVYNNNNNNFIDPSLLNKFLPPIQEWTKFSGEGDYDHINFIKYIDHILTVYRSPDEAILTRLPRLFEGVAFDCFISKQATMGQQSWPALKELIKQQFGTRLWEKKMRRAFENDYFDLVKHNPHQWCLNQKKRIECIYPKLDQEQINDLILNQTKGSLENNVRCRINDMDCELSTLIGVMEEVVEMTGINKKHNPSDKRDYTPRTDPPQKLESKPAEPIRK